MTRIWWIVGAVTAIVVIVSLGLGAFERRVRRDERASAQADSAVAVLALRDSLRQERARADSVRAQEIQTREVQISGLSERLAAARRRADSLGQVLGAAPTLPNDSAISRVSAWAEAARDEARLCEQTLLLCAERSSLLQRSILSRDSTVGELRSERDRLLALLRTSRRDPRRCRVGIGPAVAVVYDGAWRVGPGLHLGLSCAL